MGILEPDDRELVRKYLDQKLTVPVRLDVFTATRDDDDVTAYSTGESSRQTLELVQEVASLSDAIRVELHDTEDGAADAQAAEWDILGVPTIALGPLEGSGDNGAVPRVRFVGYPGGHEFTSFLETLGSVGKKNWGLAEDTVALLSKVDRAIDIKTFVTPT